MFGSSLLVLSLAALGLAADPKPPALTFLYAINLTIPNAATVQIGNTPTGARGLLSITGGSFWGPKLNGKRGLYLHTTLLALGRPVTDLYLPQQARSASALTGV